MNFIEIKRKEPSKIAPEKRILNFNEFYLLLSNKEIVEQSERCMDCGVPFCHNSCPLGNFLPNINKLVSNEKWEEAYQLLIRQNNFPEFTGRLCPALCEGSCSLEIDYGSVTTKSIELKVIEEAFKRGLVTPQLPTYRKNMNVAIIGSGPSGLAAAHDLNKKGINVTVYEKDNRIGGLLTLGIPDYKLEEKIIDRRVEVLKEEGIQFKVGVEVGEDISLEALQKEYDAVCLATGFTVPREIQAKGNTLSGIHFALEYLMQQNRIDSGEKLNKEQRITAKDKDVLIIGGGDTGADCLGTAIRQGANSVKQIEIMPKPPKERSDKTPWPYWPHMLRKNTAHEEGGERDWNVLTTKFIGQQSVTKVSCQKVEWDQKRNMNIIPYSDYEIKADLVIIAAGFVSSEQKEYLKNLGLKFTKRNQIQTKDHMTSVDGVFAAGDLKNGPSLICKAIDDGKKAADNIMEYLNTQ